MTEEIQKGKKMGEQPILHYLVFRVTSEEMPIGQVFAKNEDAAMKEWKEFMVDGPHEVKLVQRQLQSAVVIPFI